MPGRTAETCQTKASALGLSIEGRFWTDEEDAIIKRYYPKEGQAVSQRLLNRSESSCVQRASRLGICRIKSTDAAVLQAEESPDNDQSRVKLSPEAEDISANQTMEETVGLTQIESSQTVDDTGEEQQEESDAMGFGIIQM